MRKYFDPEITFRHIKHLIEQAHPDLLLFIGADDRLRTLLSSSAKIEFLDKKSELYKLPEKSGRVCQAVVVLDNILATVENLSFVLMNILDHLVEDGRLLLSIQNPAFAKCTMYSNFSISQYVRFLEQCGSAVENIEGEKLGSQFDSIADEVAFVTARKVGLKKCQYTDSYEMEKLISIYDGLGENYSSMLSGVDYGIPRWVRERIMKWKPAGRNVLDLGCADGFLAGIVSSIDSDFEFWGVDASQIMAQVAQQSGRYRSVVNWDLRAGFPQVVGNYYAAVLAFGVFDFLSSPGQLIDDIVVALMDGGKLFVSFELKTEEGMQIVL